MEILYFDTLKEIINYFVIAFLGHKDIGDIDCDSCRLAWMNIDDISVAVVALDDEHSVIDKLPTCCVDFSDLKETDLEILDSWIQMSPPNEQGECTVLKVPGEEEDED